MKSNIFINRPVKSASYEISSFNMFRKIGNETKRFETYYTPLKYYGMKELTISSSPIDNIIYNSTKPNHNNICIYNLQLHSTIAKRIFNKEMFDIDYSDPAVWNDCPHYAEWGTQICNKLHDRIATINMFADNPDEWVCYVIKSIMMLKIDKYTLYIPFVMHPTKTADGSKRRLRRPCYCIVDNLPFCTHGLHKKGFTHNKKRIEEYYETYPFRKCFDFIYHIEECFVKCKRNELKPEKYYAEIKRSCKDIQQFLRAHQHMMIRVKPKNIKDESLKPRCPSLDRQQFMFMTSSENESESESESSDESECTDKDSTSTDEQVDKKENASTKDKPFPSEYSTPPEKILEPTKPKLNAPIKISSNDFVLYDSSKGEHVVFHDGIKQEQPKPQQTSTSSTTTLSKDTSKQVTHKPITDKPVTRKYVSDKVRLSNRTVTNWRTRSTPNTRTYNKKTRAISMSNKYSVPIQREPKSTGYYEILYEDY